MRGEQGRRTLFSGAALALAMILLATLVVLAGPDLATVAAVAVVVATTAALAWYLGERAAKHRDGAVPHAAAPAVPADHPQAFEIPPRPEVLTTVPSFPLPAPRPIDSATVLSTVLDSVGEAGSPVAASLWIEDEPTATLRPVDTVGTMPPASTPLSTQEDPVAASFAGGRGVMEAVAELTLANRSATLWRLVLPLIVGDSRGAAIVDFVQAQEPDASVAGAALAPLLPALSGSLALHVARIQSEGARFLTDAARDLSRRLDADDVLDYALDRATTMAHAATGSIMLLQDDGTLTIARSRGLPDEVVRDTHVRPGDGIAGWVLSTGKPVLVEDLPTTSTRGTRHGVHCAVSAPIADEEGPLGVLNVGSREVPARLTRRHMEALDILGSQTCVAYRNAQAVTAARDLYLSTLKALAVAMELKDPYAHGCTERIVEYVMRLAGAMGFSREERDALELAGLFHDVGMVSVGRGVAESARALTTVERGLLAMHPVVAADMLREIPALEAVVPIVYHHHERFDGTGYVAGVEGDDIPLGARVLSVVDAYVAMTSRRPYRHAYTGPQAVEELRRNAGTQFDPEVVQAFVGLLGEGVSRSRGAVEG